MVVMGRRGLSNLGPVEKVNLIGLDTKGSTHNLFAFLVVYHHLLDHLLSLSALR